MWSRVWGKIPDIPSICIKKKLNGKVILNFKFTTKISFLFLYCNLLKIKTFKALVLLINIKRNYFFPKGHLLITKRIRLNLFAETHHEIFLIKSEIPK